MHNLWTSLHPTPMLALAPWHTSPFMPQVQQALCLLVTIVPLAKWKDDIHTRLNNTVWLLICDFSGFWLIGKGRNFHALASGWNLIKKMWCPPIHTILTNIYTARAVTIARNTKSPVWCWFWIIKEMMRMPTINDIFGNSLIKTVQEIFILQNL